MDRATKRIYDPSGETDSIGYTSDYNKMGEAEREYKIIERLADYEDSGLEPEEVMELQMLCNWYNIHLHKNNNMMK